MARNAASIVKLNNKGFNQVRTSRAMQEYLQKIANETAESAGDGFEVSVKTAPGGSRSRAYVSAATYAARRAESERGVLTQAIANEAADA